MEYLGRDDAPLTADLWNQIDDTVISAARETLTARRFIHIAGPVGPGAQFAKINHEGREEVFENGFVKTVNREIREIPQLYSDFWLYWRDLEALNCGDCVTPPDFSAATVAAKTLAQTEDRMIFYGIPEMGIDGLLTSKNTVSLGRGDWSQGENSFTDVAAAMTRLEENNFVGRYALVLSPDMYIKLQRIQPGTGVLEIDRIKSLLINGDIFKSTLLKPGTAMLLCCDAYCMDLLLGQDIVTSYLEAVDLNHHFRVLETALFRLKRPEAVVVFKGAKE